jgi:hypothetical protein
VAAHLLEASIVGALMAHKDRVHRGLHVVVDAARASALEEGEHPVMGEADQGSAGEAGGMSAEGSNTISCVSRGYARTNSIRLWHNRTCATVTVTVTVVPLISTISWLQSNW